MNKLFVASLGVLGVLALVASSCSAVEYEFSMNSVDVNTAYVQSMVIDADWSRQCAGFVTELLDQAMRKSRILSTQWRQAGLQLIERIYQQDRVEMSAKADERLLFCHESLTEQVEQLAKIIKQ